MATDQPSERERDLERFLTFVDAIVAIAITLLVLPLVELPARVEDYGSVGSLLSHNADELYAFALSFLVVSRFWFIQHRAVRNLIGYDGRVAGLLMLWCFSIVFLPFPTGLVAETAGSATTKVLYVGTMIFSILAIVAVEVAVRRNPALTDGSPGGDPALGLANAVAIGLALVIMLLVPAASYAPLLLLIVADRVPGALRRLLRR